MAWPSKTAARSVAIADKYFEGVVVADRKRESRGRFRAIMGREDGLLRVARAFLIRLPGVGSPRCALRTNTPTINI